MKKIIGVVVFLGVIGLGLGIGFFFKKDQLVTSKIQKGLEAITGLEIKMGAVTLTEGGKRISIDSILVGNAPNYAESSIVRLSDVVLFCPSQAYLIGGGFRCEKITATFDEISIERMLDGGNNLSEVNALNPAILDPPVDSAARAKSGFMIERLELQMEILVLYEQIQDQPRRKTEVDLGGRKEVYGFITDPHTLVYIPVLKAIGELGRGSLGIPRTKIQQKIVQSTGKP